MPHSSGTYSGALRPAQQQRASPALAASPCGIKAGARPLPDEVALTALCVPPAPVSEMQDDFAMGTPAVLATPTSSGEADLSRELGPVDGIEPAVLAPD